MLSLISSKRPVFSVSVRAFLASLPFCQPAYHILRAHRINVTLRMDSAQGVPQGGGNARLYVWPTVQTGVLRLLQRSQEPGFWNLDSRSWESGERKLFPVRCALRTPAQSRNSDCHGSSLSVKEAALLRTVRPAWDGCSHSTYSLVSHLYHGRRLGCMAHHGEARHGCQSRSAYKSSSHSRCDAAYKGCEDRKAQPLGRKSRMPLACTNAATAR